MRVNPSGAIYGTIMVGALLAAESAQRETYIDTIAAAALALLLSALVHAYAAGAEERLTGDRPITLKGVGHWLVHELQILAGATLPIFALVIFGAAGARLSTAVDAAVWTSAGAVVVIEVTAAVSAGKTGRQLATQAGIGAVFGLLVVAINAVLH